MSDGFDEVPAAVDTQVPEASPIPVEAAPEPVEANQQSAEPSAHESVLRRLMDRLEAIGQGLDSELSHWMQKAREIL